LQWVRCAVDAGLHDKALIAEDPDIEALRGHPAFNLVYQKLQLTAD
jgi:hypothetical protein